VRHRQHRALDGAIGDRLVGVEERVDHDRRDQHQQHQEGDRDERSPYPPAGADPAQHGVEHGGDEREQDDAHRQAGELLHEPGAEALRRHGVLVLAKVALVDRQGQRERPGCDRVQRTEERVAQEGLAADAAGPVAHARGAPARQQDQGDGQAEEEVPEQQPVAALEVVVRSRHHVDGQAVEVGLCRCLGIAGKARAPAVVDRADSELRSRRRVRRLGGGTRSTTCTRRGRRHRFGGVRTGQDTGQDEGRKAAG